MLRKMEIDLSDRVIFLQPLTQEDAAGHLAGEDEEIAKWLSGGRSTLLTVRDYISRCDQDWCAGGAVRAFGIFDCETRTLIGSIEANLAFFPEPNRANVSFSVFPTWRGQGIALRALHLMLFYLKTHTPTREAVLRIPLKNFTSLRVAEKSGFALIGIFDEDEGRMANFTMQLRLVEQP